MIKGIHKLQNLSNKEVHEWISKLPQWVKDILNDFDVGQTSNTLDLKLKKYAFASSLEDEEWQKAAWVWIHYQ